MGYLFGLIIYILKKCVGDFKRANNVLFCSMSERLVSFSTVSIFDQYYMRADSESDALIIFYGPSLDVVVLLFYRDIYSCIHKAS